jgi:hypothetical protein
MQTAIRKNALLVGLGVCFAIVIGTSALSGRPASALGFLAVGAFAAALHGAPVGSPLRLPLYAVSLVSSLMVLFAVFVKDVA